MISSWPVSCQKGFRTPAQTRWWGRQSSSAWRSSRRSGRSTSRSRTCSRRTSLLVSGKDWPHWLSQIFVKPWLILTTQAITGPMASSTTLLTPPSTPPREPPSLRGWRWSRTTAASGLLFFYINKISIKNHQLFCIFSRFVARTNENDYVDIIPGGGGCYAQVPYRTGRGRMEIGLQRNGCVYEKVHYYYGCQIKCHHYHCPGCGSWASSLPRLHAWDEQTRQGHLHHHQLEQHCGECVPAYTVPFPLSRSRDLGHHLLLIPNNLIIFAISLNWSLNQSIIK